MVALKLSLDCPLISNALCSKAGDVKQVCVYICVCTSVCEYVGVYMDVCVTACEMVPQKWNCIRQKR